jgi:hypothetical protein
MIVAPFVLILGPPIVGAALAVELSKNCFGRFGDRGFFAFIATIILVLLGFALGAVSLIIVVPGAICLGLPAYLIFIVYERIKKYKHARRKMQERMQEALEIQRQMDQIEGNGALEYDN